MNTDKILGPLNTDAGIRAFSQDVFYPAMRLMEKTELPLEEIK